MIAAIARQAILLNVAVFVCGLALALLILTVILIPVTFLGWAVLGLIAVILPPGTPRSSPAAYQGDVGRGTLLG